jgi:hypothetical protein
VAVDLVFREGPATGQPVVLVFNDSVEAPSKDILVNGAGTLPPLQGGALVAANVVPIAGAGFLPALVGGGELRYLSDTQRPVVGGVVEHFQDGLEVAASHREQAQVALALRAAHRVVAERAVPVRAATVARWQQASALRVRSTGRYQQALKRRQGFEDHFQEAVRHRLVVADSYQVAIARRAALAARFQEALKRRTEVQDRAVAAIPARAWMLAPAQRGLPAGRRWLDRYQDAIRPRGGRWQRPLPPEPPEPCYVPGTDLVFAEPWSASTDLVFVCERATGPVDPTDPTDPPASLVVVPIQRKYFVLNTASLRRIDGDIDIPIVGMSLSLDADSWTWGFSARVPGDALALLEPGANGARVEAEARINGVAYRVLIEGLTRDRVFGRTDLSVNGRGKAALLDAPYVPVMTFGNAGGARTAQQLANEVLSSNGVPIGWDVDAGWRPEDWLVSAGAFSHQGTYISALNTIAAAVGAYVQPHRTAQALSVLMRYPVKPWEWSDVVPDYQLPAAVVQREGIAWTDKPIYNRIYVRGAQVGVLGVATRAGTAGDVEKPMVTDALITAAAAARQRAQAELSDVGRQAEVSLRLPVLAETGIIPPGKFVRYVDAGVTRMGLVRSVSASVERNDKKLLIWQTIGVETHVS